MAEQPQNNSSSDEIHLGQLFQFIERGFNKVFVGVLRFFLFFKKNMIVLLGLGLVGIAIGYGLKQIISKKMKIEVIVRPNLESREYLYDVVAEVAANIKAENQDFFSGLGITADQIKDFEIRVESLGDKNNKLEDELKYLELLKGLEVSGSVSDIVRDEILSRNSLNHKIIFLYKDRIKGEQVAQKIMEYINSNPYFNTLIEVYRENAESRLVENTALIKQLDELIARYSENLAQKKEGNPNGPFVMDNEERIDIPALFDFKNKLIKDNESKKVELYTRGNAVKVINFGKPQERIFPFFGKTPVLVPLVLLGGFFLWHLIRFLDKKAGQLE